jgi:hypothetical protein
MKNGWLTLRTFIERRGVADRIADAMVGAMKISQVNSEHALGLVRNRAEDRLLQMFHSE